MSKSFAIPFNLKIKEPKSSKLHVYVKPTDDYATLKGIFDKLTRKYNYKYEFQSDDDGKWIFKVSNLNDMYNSFIHDLVKYAKTYKITSMTSNDKIKSQLYIDFIVPNHHLYGKYKLNKYNEPEYKGEIKTAEYIINKIMTETFKKGFSQHVYKMDKTRYGIAYDIFDLDKKNLTIDDWRKFYHRLYYLEQMFLDLKIKIQSNNPEYKQLVKCLHEPELLFKGKHSVEFEIPRYNLGINDELNKIMKRVVKKGEYFKDLPETSNYSEFSRFILKNELTDKQVNELKHAVKKIKTSNVKLRIDDKEIKV